MTLNDGLRHISAQEFAHLGVADIAYVKRIVVNDEPVFAMHAADGRPIALAKDYALAVAALAQHDLEAVSVH